MNYVSTSFVKMRLASGDVATSRAEVGFEILI